jgi:UDP-glucose 4-epimerase
MFGVDAVTIRPFNNYGPPERQGLRRRILLTVRRIMCGEAPIVEGDGQQTRDFIFEGHDRRDPEAG